MTVLRYIGNMLAERRRIKDVSKQYSDAYARCFEGTPEDMDRKLDAWDSIHRMTRHFNYTLM